ncbi:MAG: Crp/Fnr family transcriptional regulator [Eubacteriales bacterium]
MEDYYPVVKDNPLFHHLNQEEFHSILACLGGFTKDYEKRDVIFLSGEKIEQIGLVLSGSVKVFQEDIHGNRTILAHISVGDTFAEVFPCADLLHSPVTVEAKEESKILFLNYQKILKTCDHSCGFHGKLVENLLKMIALKCVSMSEKVEILSKRSTREKILAFLGSKGKGKIIIDLNREEMANYIAVDRSALSAELSRMQKEGILLFHKNQFELL